jgi:hypothetical protein
MDFYIKNYKIISLGYNCTIKGYLESFIKDEPTNLFDYTGSPMWGINNFFENNFSSLFNLEDYDYFHILKNDKKTVTNKKYYFRYKHEFKINEETNNLKTLANNLSTRFILKNIINANNLNIKNQIKNLFEPFKLSFQRKIERLNNHLINEKQILFIRIEEIMDNRIIYEPYKYYYQKPELEYVKDFSNIIKTKYPDLVFKIIYLTKQSDTIYLKDLNLILIKADIDNIKFVNSPDKISELFLKNKDFLEATI